MRDWSLANRIMVYSRRELNWRRSQFIFLLELVKERILHFNNIKINLKSELRIKRFWVREFLKKDKIMCTIPHLFLRVCFDVSVFILFFDCISKGILRWGPCKLDHRLVLHISQAISGRSRSFHLLAVRLPCCFPSVCDEWAW